MSDPRPKRTLLPFAIGLCLLLIAAAVAIVYWHQVVAREAESTYLVLAKRFGIQAQVDPGPWVILNAPLSFLGMRPARPVYRVEIYGSSVQGDALRFLTTIDTLAEVQLDIADLDDEKMKLVARIPALRDLSIRHNDRVTDVGLAHLHHARHLRRIVLYGTKVTDRGVDALKSARPGVEIAF